MSIKVNFKMREIIKTVNNFYKFQYCPLQMEDLQFEFPDAQDREDLKKVRCYDDLRIFLLDLKRS